MICKKGNTFMKDKIKEEFECTDKEAVEIKKSFTNVLTSCLLEGLPFSFKNFAVFVPGTRPGRTGKDPFGKPYKSEDTRSLVVRLNSKVKGK